MEHKTALFTRGNTVCLYITGDTYEELKEYFEKLSIDAELDPLTEHFFGIYGAHTDKFSIRWMFKGERKVKNGE